MRRSGKPAAREDNSGGPGKLDGVLSYSRSEGWTGMKTTRKRYSADFKAKVSLQAIDAAFLDMPWYGSRQIVRCPSSEYSAQLPG
jgi:hypothetical protein